MISEVDMHSAPEALLKPDIVEKAATERLLVCVSGSPYSEKLIRSACRLAGELKGEWYALYIETPGSSREVRENRERIWHNLRLAESLGGQVGAVTAVDITGAVIDYAARHNISRIVMGKPAKPRWREMIKPALVDRVIRASGDIDVVVVSIGEKASGRRGDLPPCSGTFRLQGYTASLMLVAGATLLCELLRPVLAPTNMVMFYLLAVVIAAVRLGRRPALLSALLGVLAFDLFFVPPRLTFAVADTQYLLTFIGLLVVGGVISTLVARAKERAEAMRAREVQTASLYYLSRDLAAAADTDAVIRALLTNVEEALKARVVIMLPEGERLDIVAGSEGVTLDGKEQAVADWAFRNNHPAGQGTDTLVSAGLLYLPLQTRSTILGVMGVRLEQKEQYLSQEHRRLLDAFATQAAMALERISFSHQAEQAQILQARENLERALLNSISHDLRTPLVTITGALDSLREQDSRLSDAARRELIEAAGSEAERLNRFVGNLLDMTRIEAAAVRLRIEPCDIQDLIGCALAAIEQRIGSRTVHVDISDDLPLVPMDLVLMTQVVVNLLDNAHKYSPLSSPVGITGTMEYGWLRLDITDLGPGIPEHDLRRVFDKFYRIPVPEGAGGTGLGLSICKGIVEAHGGTVSAENRPDGGLRVMVRLPVGA